jgi:formylglycine-generating enzyme required for sulfatase activity
MNKFVGQILFVVLLLSIAASACAPESGQPTLVPNTTRLPPDSMALVPAGTFTMGDSADHAFAECQKYREECERAWFAVEEPAHSVDLPAFYMDVYEVTNGGYKACETAGKCKPPRLTASATHKEYYGNAQYANYPVIDVDWDSAKTYCEWRGARLPTEAEWEYAARGTDGRTFPWGEVLDKTRANYGDSKLGDPVAVGSYESGKSPYGMYDMAGNVWEWMADWYDVYPGGSPSASPDFGKKARTLRGGAWLDPGNGLLSAFRGGLDPTHSFGNIGFRCARSAP